MWHLSFISNVISLYELTIHGTTTPINPKKTSHSVITPHSGHEVSPGRIYLKSKQFTGAWILIIWVRSRNCGCLVTWFCYHLIAKPGNKTAAVSWPDPYDAWILITWHPRHGRHKSKVLEHNIIQHRNLCTVETLYSTIYYSKYFIELNFDKSTYYVALWTHKRHPIPRPFGRAMECLLWVL